MRIFFWPKRFCKETAGSGRSDVFFGLQLGDAEIQRIPLAALHRGDPSDLSLFLHDAVHLLDHLRRKVGILGQSGLVVHRHEQRRVGL